MNLYQYFASPDWGWFCVYEVLEFIPHRARFKRWQDTQTTRYARRVISQSDISKNPIKTSRNRLCYRHKRFLTSYSSMSFRKKVYAWIDKNIAHSLRFTSKPLHMHEKYHKNLFSIWCNYTHMQMVVNMEKLKYINIYNTKRLIIKNHVLCDEVWLSDIIICYS